MCGYRIAFGPGVIRMNKSSNGSENGTFAKYYQTQRSWLFDIEPYGRPPQTYDEVADDQRLKRMLRRAVTRTAAPVSLIESIRKEIRK